MPDGMIQKERKKRIIKQTAMKAILVIILVCIAMITFLLLFQVRKIEVSGNQYLSRQEIADWVQDDNWSSNSLYVMIRNHLMNHELLPAMEEANVTMKNPWTVKVTIKEKRVAGYTALQRTSGQQGEQKSIWEPSGYDDDTEKM